MFCFQPAEEGGAGAEAMIEDGLFERFPVKGVYGLHNWPGLDVGKFAVARGPAMASADRLDIVVKGFGGHAAMPHRVNDPIVAAAEIVLAAQTIVSRVIDPLRAGGGVDHLDPRRRGLQHHSRQGGDAGRLPRLLGCGRGADRDGAAPHLRRGRRGARRQRRGDARRGADQGLPRDRQSSSRKPTSPSKRCAPSRDAENVDDGVKPVMGSEDFSFMLKRVPGAYIFIGNGDSAPLHHPAYDFNDEALPHGVAYWSELARRVLPPA